MQVDKFNTLKICTYNCLNFKANSIMVKKLIDDNDVSFFIEHLLGNEEDYLFNDICSSTHSIIFKSSFDKKMLNGTYLCLCFKHVFIK